MSRVLIILLAFMVICLAMIWHLTPAHADPVPCLPLKPLLDQLAITYHEFVVLTGDATGHQMIVTMSSAGTFSVVISDGQRGCIVFAGEKAELDKGI